MGRIVSKIKKVLRTLVVDDPNAGGKTSTASHPPCNAALRATTFSVAVAAAGAVMSGFVDEGLPKQPHLLLQPPPPRPRIPPRYLWSTPLLFGFAMLCSMQFSVPTQSSCIFTKSLSLHDVMQTEKGAGQQQGPIPSMDVTTCEVSE